MIHGAAFVILAGLAQVHPKNPHLWYSKDLGISVMKPPKKEEWKFEKTRHFFKNTDFSVKNVVDEVSIDFRVFLSPPAQSGQKNFDSGDAEIVIKQGTQAISKDPDWKVKKKRVVKATLPRRGDGGVTAWYRELEVADQDDKEFEWRTWVYVTKASRSLCYIHVIGPPGSYKKNRKDIEAILSTVRTYKVKKK